MMAILEWKAWILRLMTSLTVWFWLDTNLNRLGKREQRGAQSIQVSFQKLQKLPLQIFKIKLWFTHGTEESTSDQKRGGGASRRVGEVKAVVRSIVLNFHQSFQIALQSETVLQIHLARRAELKFTG